MEHQSQSFFTLEENLTRYRTRVTSWYCEEHKTVQDIVELLEQDGVLVTESHIQQCLLSWSILQAPYIALAAVSNMNYSSEHELGPASSSSGVLPTHSSIQKSTLSYDQDSRRRASSSPRQSPSSFKVKCYDGPDQLEVETTLDVVPDGPSRIEDYVAAENESHEKLAIRLEKNGVRRDALFKYRRAGDVTPSILARGRKVREKTRMKDKKTLTRRRDMANDKSQSRSAPAALE